eukprot:gb/GECH01007227.1/.p1 GENE.gb/GECH01007227.1/~~gb/GECH01007227.1/.p1  ORF type:complete len:211 (+),score=57.35 gb/GECH01007227.1/:1-633(+)
MEIEQLAATKIQSLWKGYKTRKKCVYQVRKEYEDLVYNLENLARIESSALQNITLSTETTKKQTMCSEINYFVCSSIDWPTERSPAWPRFLSEHDSSTKGKIREDKESSNQQESNEEQLKQNTSQISSNNKSPDNEKSSLMVEAEKKEREESNNSDSDDENGVARNVKIEELCTEISLLKEAINKRKEFLKSSRTNSKENLKQYYQTELH